ncbi:hypothetical protein BZG36_01548 [Bifiguratus adelaidae]|uniref:Elongation factor P n=1 Tax=Bifiguratus adelaidae TaxID=1938954 RepID=A0A261Y3X0_9FUNG|nr:hypothetical protein BZG36_01548 [Bifiguratus adelaidae]
MLRLAVVGRSWANRRAAVGYPVRHYKLAVNAIRRGQVIDHKGKAYKVSATEHKVMGRGGGLVKMEMVDIIGGGKLSERFRPSESLEILDLREDGYTFLYADDSTLHFLHPATLEEIELSADLIDGGSEMLGFLTDGMQVQVHVLTTPKASYPITFTLPKTHTYTVAKVQDRVSQDSKRAAFRPAWIEEGVRVEVPEFVGVGDTIVVDLEKREYVRRA